ncbi:ACT domain-containing protein [Nakamurella endophytica]|uniref:Uncharacterized protein n=1 Tax=Nakamurella endophytica TaxID=1748367 RepID=A0A917T6A3_9ACTN|nr:ACT domain-containing protein [Nakamurella endophytica]GGM12734.1 hypothetical protein GCM10011594_35840 [Nakamurella endophytica]
MAGATDLDTLLRDMEPVLRDGEYVFVVHLDPPASDGPDPAGPGGPGLPAEALVREDEGLTLVLRREVADARGLPYDFVAAWITLQVHSSLAAVGLTAAFAGALADAGISCNTVAGYHHDHLLVPVGDRDAALAVLRGLSRSGRVSASRDGGGTRTAARRSSSAGT